jgi:hypothetical protein
LRGDLYFAGCAAGDDLRKTESDLCCGIGGG